MSVEFKDNRMKVINAIDDAIYKWLIEASGEVASRTARNSRVDTGQLKSSWIYFVDKENNSSQIGSQLENAIWEEWGTGIKADDGKGRQTPWVYRDKDGEWHYTRGKSKNPKGLLYSFNSVKNKLIRRFNDIVASELK